MSNDLTKLDFDTSLQDLKDFLSNKEAFTDYNFSGSNISILLEGLTNETTKQAFISYLVSKESFIQSAKIRGNVVNHAKNLGYIPHSVAGSRAIVNIVVSNPIGTNPTSLTLPDTTRLTSTINGVEYSYVVAETVQASISNDGKFYFNNVEIIQGTRKRSIFRFDDRIPNQKFIIPNKDVDISTLKVTVRDNERSTTGTVYNKYDGLANIEPTTMVYFLQENYSGNYEIYFGDNRMGRKPSQNNIVVLDYVFSKGSVSNGAALFSITDSIQGNTDIQITTVSNAMNGLEKEDIESIRFLAPLVKSSAGNAITESDYTALILQNFPTIESINVWGGQTTTPPTFAQVNIALKPKDADVISDQLKGNIINFLSGLNVIDFTPVIYDPVFTYIQVESYFKYDPDKTSLSKIALETKVKETIQTYNDNQLERFKTVFRASNVVSLIDSTDRGILSNILRVFMYKYISPSNNSYNFFELDFVNPIYESGENEVSIKSDPITISGVNHFLGDVATSKVGVRRVYLYRITEQGNQIVNDDVGSITTGTGKVILYNFIPDTTTPLKITVLPASDDLFTKFDQMLRIGTNQMKAVGEIDTISRGGSGYGAVDYNSVSRGSL